MNFEFSVKAKRVQAAEQYVRRRSVIMARHCLQRFT